MEELTLMQRWLQLIDQEREAQITHEVAIDMGNIQFEENTYLEYVIISAKRRVFGNRIWGCVSLKEN